MPGKEDRRERFEQTGRIGDRALKSYVNINLFAINEGLVEGVNEGLSTEEILEDLKGYIERLKFIGKGTEINHMNDEFTGIMSQVGIDLKAASLLLDNGIPEGPVIEVESDFGIESAGTPEGYLTWTNALRELSKGGTDYAFWNEKLSKDEEVQKLFKSHGTGKIMKESDFSVLGEIANGYLENEKSGGEDEGDYVTGSSAVQRLSKESRPYKRVNELLKEIPETEQYFVKARRGRGSRVLKSNIPVIRKLLDDHEEIKDREESDSVLVNHVLAGMDIGDKDDALRHIRENKKGIYGGVGVYSKGRHLYMPGSNTRQFKGIFERNYNQG
jgi:hypothetical protein